MLKSKTKAINSSQESNHSTASLSSTDPKGIKCSFSPVKHAEFSQC